MDDEKRCCRTCRFWDCCGDSRTGRCTKLVWANSAELTDSVELIVAGTQRFASRYLRTESTFPGCGYWEEIPRTFTVELTPLSRNRIHVNVLTPEKVHDLGSYNGEYTLRSLLEMFQRRGIEGDR